MSITDPTLKIGTDDRGNIKDELSPYKPTDEEKAIRQEVIARFTLGYTTMYTPRVEFNDLSVIARDQTDFLAFNVYQPNNGDSFPGDQINGWHSNAIRPIERNKVISAAGHATAHLLFPKVFAHDSGSEPQEDAAIVMRSLMEWVGEKYRYAWSAIQAVMQALVAPASIMHKEYVQVYRKVRSDDGTGKLTEKDMLDEDESGFKDNVVSVDELYIENFFEPDIQKQGWLVWRRVHGMDRMREKYGHLPNFQYVKPGMQILFNDANQGFYWVYDPNMRSHMCEEVLYYEKRRDLFLVFVNGVLLTRFNNPNPRWDKLYPFVKFGYEFIRAAKCFYYKSLVFKVSHDANIINTLYPIIIDGSYLNVMPPFINIGSEMIGSDVIIPGGVTTLSSPNAQLTPIKMATDLKSGLDAMFKVEESVSESSESTVSSDRPGTMTAYEISKREEERQRQIGPFIQMIAQFVWQYGRLQMGDILQHLTVADADQITDSAELVYKTFLMPLADGKSGKKFRKISFDASVGEEGDEMKESYKTLKAQGGIDAKTELFRVHPENLRALNFSLVVSPDVLAPRSEDVERLYMLEAFDRAIQHPEIFDQEQVARDFFLEAYPKSARDPDKYIVKPQPGAPAAIPGLPSRAGAAMTPPPGAAALPTPPTSNS